MTHESAVFAWQLRFMILKPSSASLNLKLYVLFLFLVCIFTTIKLVRVWRIVAPFSGRHPGPNLAYRGFLRASAASMQHLISLTYLAMGIFASVTVYGISDHFLANEGTDITLAITALIRRLSSALTVALFVSLYAFLVRWYFTERLEKFRKLRLTS